MKKLVIPFIIGVVGFSSMQANAQTPWYTTGNVLNTDGRLGTNAGSNFGIIFRSNGSERAIFNNIGRWGLGTLTPASTSRLHVVYLPSGVAAPNGNSPLVVENNTHSYINVLAPANSDRGILFGDPGNAQDGGIVYNGINNQLQFRTNGNITRMTLTQDGTLGIGTSTPGYLLDVAGRMRIRSGGGSAGTWLTNAANNSDVAFVGMLNDNYVGLYGSALSNWGLLMNTANGNVGIGTGTPAYKLDVCGTVRAKELRVETGWCDYVFDKEYNLRSLQEVEAFIKQNKHLPDVTSGPQIESEGLEVGKVSAQMIKKIEELTLYVIELQKQVDTLKSARQ